MSRRKRWFVLVAGINGAGKSTFAQSRFSVEKVTFDAGPDFEVINPDLVTRELREKNPGLSLDEANRRAAVECEVRVRELLQVGSKSFAIETVLSTDKYKPIVQTAMSNGYKVAFVYVFLGSVKEAIARVELRVSRGGHAVPAAKIRARWPRSLANVKWFWENSTESFIFFNGDRVAEPMLVAARRGKAISFNPDALSVVLPTSF